MNKSHYLMDWPILTLYMLGNFSCFCCHRLTFFKINFFRKFYYEHYQSVKGLELKFNMSVLSWVQTVCKGNQQMIKVAASKERVKVKCKENKKKYTQVW